MESLDGPELLERDAQGLVRGMEASVQAIDEARAAATALELPFPADAIADVALCGMGGSAIAGDLVAGVYGERLRRPMAVVRDYHLPGWVGENTLVLLSSYSGGTEETLTCAMQALERGALCVAITSGGKLGGFYAAEGVPIVPVAQGLQPRQALLRLLVPVIVLLERLEVLPPVSDELEEVREAAGNAVATLAPEVPEDANPAKWLARQLIGSLVLVWGAETTAPVARRWKCQLNENAKMPAWWGELPELDHNEIVGFAGMGPLTPMTKVVTLRDARQHRQVQRRFELTADLVRRDVKDVVKITGEGATPLARAIDLVLLGDYASLYLALLRDLDPGPVDMIERLKESLASTPYGRITEP